MPRIASRSRCRALIAALLVAVVLMQTLGLMHRIVHGGLAHGGFAYGTLSAAEADAGQQVGKDHWTRSLFAGHGHASACDLYDQVTQGDALWSVPVIVLASIEVPAPAALHRAWHIAAQSAGFLARGPPGLG
jgi:hypothetical protein